MFVKEKMKLNRFKQVRIPSKAEYMAKFGEVKSAVPYTGDEIAENLGRKTDQMRQVLEDMEAFDKQREAEGV